ncbi:MAG: DUF4982 domain-containing protein [Marinilabiliales bacterium]|nr:DUF4982 domain-containing protein [Marinilabiliales bacterium]
MMRTLFIFFLTGTGGVIKPDKLPVYVYTNGDCAELFLNGKSLGMRCKEPASGKSVERSRLMWPDVTYHPGELKAIAYKEGTAYRRSSS